jgi:hypothetical protein
MKKHNLDKLFHDKLDHHQSAPSHEAWEKLEESLEQRSRKPIWTWMSIAASAALAIVSSWYMFSIDAPTRTFEYSYSDNQPGDVDVPREIVFVPVFVQVAETTTQPKDQVTPPQAQFAQTKEDNHIQLNDKPQTDVILADNKVFEHQLAPVIQEPLPLTTNAPEDIAIASNKEVEKTEETNTLEPLTITYKQGEPESKSNFTKAINYMEDVRNGEKKLVNFKKLRENIQSKFKSNKDVNSK